MPEVHMEREKAQMDLGMTQQEEIKEQTKEQTKDQTKDNMQVQIQTQMKIQKKNLIGTLT